MACDRTPDGAILGFPFPENTAPRRVNQNSKHHKIRYENHQKRRKLRQQQPFPREKTLNKIQR
jgi:hypothetical protein